MYIDIYIYIYVYSNNYTHAYLPPSSQQASQTEARVCVSSIQPVNKTLKSKPCTLNPKLYQTDRLSEGYVSATSNQ